MSTVFDLRKASTSSAQKDSNEFPKPVVPTDTPADLNIPDNYVAYTLRWTTTPGSFI